MSFTRPFVTRRFIDYEEGDSYRHPLSIAFRAIDEFTSEPSQSEIRVMLKEIPRLRRLRNLSGHYGFEEIAPGNYTLLVEPDQLNANWFYVKPLQGPWTDTFEIPIVVVPNVLLSFDLTLSPRPSYPFPSNATLVRGIVTQGTPAGVANAVVGTTYDQVNPQDTTQTVPKTVETLSTRDGEYVLFLNRLPQDTQAITLTAAKDGKQTQRPELIREGQTLKANPLDLPV